MAAPECAVCQAPDARWACGDCARTAYCGSACARHDWDANEHMRECVLAAGGVISAAVGILTAPVRILTAPVKKAHVPTKVTTVWTSNKGVLQKIIYDRVIIRSNKFEYMFQYRRVDKARDREDQLPWYQMFQRVREVEDASAQVIMQFSPCSKQELSSCYRSIAHALNLVFLPNKDTAVTFYENDSGQYFIESETQASSYSEKIDVIGKVTTNAKGDLLLTWTLYHDPVARSAGG